MPVNQPGAGSFPLLAPIASGGHTELVYMPVSNTYQSLGEEVGVAYDKVGVAGPARPGRRVTVMPWPTRAYPVMGHTAEDKSPSASVV